MGELPDHHLDRITIESDIMAGKPVIKGTRLTVQFILKLLADGTTLEEILEEYEGLTREDIIACLRYASEAIDHSTYMPLSIEA